jgi:hypothetical protein
LSHPQFKISEKSSKPRSAFPFQVATQDFGYILTDHQLAGMLHLADGLFVFFISQFV